MPIAKLANAFISFSDETPADANGEVITLVHGFGSTKEINWVETGWTKLFLENGYRVITFDNRGHGESEKFYDEQDYSLNLMANDLLDLLNHLEIKSTHLLGYSMGSRISTAFTLANASIVKKLILSGNGYNMIEGTGDWTPVKVALLAETIEEIEDQKGLTFRVFADRTKSDRKALAACVMGARELFTEEEFQSIDSETMVAIGTEDNLAGSGEKLAALFRNGFYFPIEGRDHMRSVGDKTFKQKLLEFLSLH